MIQTKVPYGTIFLFQMIAFIAMVLDLNADGSQVLRSDFALNPTAQSEWIKFSPPDKSFVVEAPRKLSRIDKPESANSQDALFRWAKSADAYELPLASESNKYAFVIGVLNISDCQRAKDAFKEEVKDFILTIGGDNKRIVSDVEVSVNDVPGREVVYENGDVNGRVLILNAGKRIYLVIYTTDVFEKTSAPEILRIFRSFRPLKVS